MGNVINLQVYVHVIIHIKAQFVQLFYVIEIVENMDGVKMIINVNVN